MDGETEKERTCDDGFNPGVDREAPEKPTCFAEDGETVETIVCADDTDIIRGKDGKWTCDVDGDGKAQTWLTCGDGINPGVSRDGKADNPDACKDADGKDEAVVCGGEEGPQ
jgi:hypothetical protein